MKKNSHFTELASPTEIAPDYSKLEDWAAHPWKWDPSDSVPKPFRNKYHKDSIADVFFLYPTSLTARKDSRWNAPINDEKINHKTDYTSILYQASAFAEKCRLFAPRYRQAHIKSYFTKSRDSAAAAFDFAYQDVKTAFIYYLEHYNHGRPFIIAAHSQGTTHATRLIKEMIDGKPLQKQMICAYLVGMPVPDTYYQAIPVCGSDIATHCFVSWRTFKTGYVDTAFVGREIFKAAVTNPLSWRSDSLIVIRKNNTGAILRKFNVLVPSAVDAQVHGNILWTSKPRFFGSIFLTTQNYHIADINFFYSNIAENVKNRINSYLKNH
ncbi:MAG: DUF3089 domain-containing protein [Ferruginibacter sp.]